jgi:hypothetical protein
MHLTETPLDDATRATIHACAIAAAEAVGLDVEADTPATLVASVDESVHRMQRESRDAPPTDDDRELTLGAGSKPDDSEDGHQSHEDPDEGDWEEGDPEDGDDDDPAYTFGSLWGEQLVRQLGWEWGRVTFHDHGDTRAIGVFSPDRALAIYPFHFVHACLRRDTPVTILLAFDILVEAKRVPPLPPRGYENVMDNVHHAEPRG